MDQTIRFVTTRDGDKLAYAVSGSGPPLLKTANWLNHLEFDWQSPVWTHWFNLLSAHHSLYRYDIRGSGLSDWIDNKVSFEHQVADLDISPMPPVSRSSPCWASRRAPRWPLNTPCDIRSV